MRALDPVTRGLQAICSGKSYSCMCEEFWEVPMWTNMLASVSIWLQLAGYLFFPSTFPSLTRLAAQNPSTEAAALVGRVQNIPLVWIASACCIMGSVGISALAWRQIGCS